MNYTKYLNKAGKKNKKYQHKLKMHMMGKITKM